MNDKTTELPTFTRRIGGVDPHPVSVDELIGQIDAQLDTVWADAEKRGTPEGAESFRTSVQELVTLAQSLEGRANQHSEMLRSTAEAVLDSEARDYGTAMAGLDEEPGRRRAWGLIARLRGAR